MKQKVVTHIALNGRSVNCDATQRGCPRKGHAPDVLSEAQKEGNEALVKQTQNLIRILTEENPTYTEVEIARLIDHEYTPGITTPLANSKFDESNQILRHTQNFFMSEFGKDHQQICFDTNQARNMGADVSEAFVQFLKGRNISAIAVDYNTLNNILVPEDGVGHTVVLMGDDTIVDLTAIQFDPEAAIPEIYDRHVFSSLGWHQQGANSHTEGAEHTESDNTSNPLPLPVPTPKTQLNQFVNSKVINSDGTLRTVYHGSPTQIDMFDETRTGYGNDAYGSGFYFTGDKNTAESYGEHLHEVKLNIQNPIIIDGYENMSNNNVFFQGNDVVELFKTIPTIYAQPNSDEPSLIGDFCEEYWDKPEHSKQEMDKMITKMVKQSYPEISFPEIESYFPKDQVTLFRRKVKELTGCDGVIVTFPDDEPHYIAWFSEQIERVN